MIQELGGTTPEDVLKRFNLIVEKPRPDQMLTKNTSDNLPIPKCVRENLNLIGYGDWTRSRSREGSAVFSSSDLVYKVPLGISVSSSNPLSLAKERLRISKKFAKTSPNTYFFIARVDGDDSEPKVIAVQKKNNGKPVYKASFKELLSQDVSVGLQNVLENMKKVLKSDNILDGVGLHLDNSTFAKRFMIRVICSIPWFSDNIMVDGNKVSLIDNTPEVGAHTISGSFKRNLNLLRLDFSRGVISVASKVYAKFQ